MKNTNQTNKYLISGIITAFLFIFGVIVAMPTRAQAFQVGQLVDPFCWFACDDDSDHTPAPVNNIPDPTVSLSVNPASVA